MTLTVLYNSMTLFAVAIWICSLSISQSKVITVDNTGENRTHCCVKGKCPCGSFLNALQHLESDTLINITSQSVSLRGFSRIAGLINIIISGNGAVIMCNNSGIVTIEDCSNVLIVEVTWDQCGDTNHPKYTHGIGFSDVSNLTIQSSIFQNSGVCNTVVVSLAPLFAQIINSSFLYNHVVNSSRCQQYSSLFIIDNGIDEGTYVFYIADTKFHYNGVFNNSKKDKTYSALFLQSKKTRNVVIFIKNSNISANGGLGANFMCTEILGKLGVQIHGLIITDNSQGGSILTLQGNSLDLLISLSTFAYNKNGSLKVISYSSITNIVFDRLSVHHNEGTFGKQLLYGKDSVDEGAGIFLWVFSLESFINISSCNLYQ